MPSRRTPEHAVCAAVRDALDETETSQAELAAELGVSQPEVSRWCINRVPSVDDIARIEAALLLPQGWILRRAGYLPRDRMSIREAVWTADIDVARKRAILTLLQL